MKERLGRAAGTLAWWELRRFLYNGLVLLAGIASLTLVSSLADVPAGEDVVEPIAVLLFAFACNVCYTAGWLAELLRIVPAHWRRLLFWGGTLFSMGVALLPGMLWLGGAAYRWLMER
ncbi:MAG: hypothetical protein IPN85_12415 [Flavobacteriales bacterium]|nr:hypothetical protein [Flavobacteriales bacterium]MBK9288428.1 hypothetical protein [Flavobacteriales bacterium]MBL0035988.1 hypothetical protein [Flavobacteriales bacterium]